MAGSLPSLREKQKRQTREQIVRKAFELFGKLGYDRVPVEMICAEVGIARATFFNYFPQKDLLLREIARTRVERVKSIVARFGLAGHQPTFDDIIALFLEITEENARLTGGSRGLVLELWFQQAAHGPMMSLREEAIVTLAGTIVRIPRRALVDPELVAETLFAIYMATMLEWFIREEKPASWLIERMQARLELAVKGMR